MKSNGHRFKGSNRWPLQYAFSSMRRNSLRTAGIALMLAVGVTLPSTVFTWSSTGIWLTTRDYFANNIYQMRIGHSAIPQDTMTPTQIAYLNTYRDEQVAAMRLARSYSIIERVDFVPTTLGLVNSIDGERYLPMLSYYTMYGQNYRDGIKDCRVIVVNSSLLDLWGPEFLCDGTFNVAKDEIVVSEGLIEYTKDVYGADITIGSRISLDVFRHPNYQHYGSGYPWGWSHQNENNLTVVGIYNAKSLRSLISEVFPAIMRKNWDPLGLAEPVLGLDDCILLSEEHFADEDIVEMETYGFYWPGALVRGSFDNLIELGAENIQDTLLDMKLQIEEQVQNTPFDGIQRLDELQSFVDNFIQSRNLVVLTFPVLIMSMMLSITISDLSIQRRKNDVRTVRAKGASYNQILSSLMWEAMILTFLGIITGLVLSVFLSPLMGSSIDLFVMDTDAFTEYLVNTKISLAGIFVGVLIAFYLPCAYLLQIARKIDVSEIGQQRSLENDDIVESTSFRTPSLALLLVMVGLFLMSVLVEPSGAFVYVEILIVTVLLFAGAYFGSSVMRRITTMASSLLLLIIGEKQLYVRQSFRKRKGQFVPLFLILTLTMTVSAMSLIQLSSFNATLDNELRFSIGADLRIECWPKELEFNETLYKYPGVVCVAPVVETIGSVASSTFFIEGVRPHEYLQVGIFREDCFVGATPEEVLDTLNQNSQGIVISEYYAKMWNKTIGSNVFVSMQGSVGDTSANFVVVGICKSAPGFGLASTEENPRDSFASQFGFQAEQGGFALVNLDFLVERTKINTTELFLVDTACWAQEDEIIQNVEADINTKVYDPDDFEYRQVHNINLFLSAFTGVSSVIILVSTTMGLASIGFFLSSDIAEREDEYAVLRAVGASKGQVFSIVFGEFAATVLAAAGISLVLGIAFGYTMSLLTVGVAPFASAFPAQLTFPSLLIGISFGLDISVMIISCYLPAKRAGTVDPAVVLRNL
ncbi:MAG: FtsX-like permease family protein [Candidatus Thorarchaeota archaeon]